MTHLTSHLPFASSSSSASGSGSTSGLPPPSTQLVISDTLQSPAHFALYHLVSAALGKEKRKVIWVDFRGEGRSSWEAVLKKLGTPIPPQSSPSFIHIAPTSLPPPIILSTANPGLFSSQGPSLRSTYDAIIPHLPMTHGERDLLAGPPTAAAGPLVILDGLAELLRMGFTPVEVGRFVRAVLSRVRESQATLVSILHADSLPISSPSSNVPITSPETDLLIRLLRLGQGVWWRVSHLPSGRSGDVMGEISSHPLTSPPQTKESIFPSTPRSQPLQYRLEQSTVRVFPKGTGRGFL